ncbi:MAG: UDP binding domain-containing protein, partial [Nitrososphaera sp.]
PKDPYLLLSAVKTNRRSVIRIARTINDSMPGRVLEIIKSGLLLRNQVSKYVEILILGTSYKPEVADSRNSPAQKVISGLKSAGFQNIRVHDPYSNESFGARQVVSLRPALIRADCVVILTGHRLYYSLTPRDFKRNAVLVDTVRVLNQKDYRDTELIYCTIGLKYPKDYLGQT